MVELTDGSIIAQLGVTDMRLPIQYAFSYPERWAAPLPSLDLARAGRLDFEVPDTTAFPCLQLAYRALAAERSLPVVLNAANEIAVDALPRGTHRVHRNSRDHRAQTMDAHVSRPKSPRSRPCARWMPGHDEYAAEIARGLELKV